MSRVGRHKLKSYGLTLTFGVCLLAASVITARFAHAGGNDGPGSPSLGGYCGDSSASSWSDTCYGATWRYSEVTGNLPALDSQGYATVSGTSNQPGGTVGPCGEEETDDQGNVTGFKVWTGYYVLGLEKYSPSVYSSTGSPEAASLGENSGIHQNGKLCIVLNQVRPGCTSFQEVKGSVPFGQAKALYEVAQAHGAANSSWDGDLGWFCWDDSWGGGTPGTPSTPPSTPPSGGADGEGEFFSRSHAMTTPQSHDVGNHDEVSDWDGAVYLYVSTDNSSFYAHFKHDMRYLHQSGSGVFENALTSWYVYETIDGVATTNVANGAFNNVPGGTTTEFPDLADTNSSTIHLDKGQTKTICHIINYDQKKWNFHYSGGAQIQPPNGATGTGSSKACVVVTRPNDTDGSDDSTPHGRLQIDTSGSSKGTVAYAGETADMSWTTRVESIPTRRFAEYQQIVYLVSDTKARRSEYYTGNYANNYDASTGGSRRSSRSPCEYYGDNRAWESSIAGSFCRLVDNRVGIGNNFSGHVNSNSGGDVRLNYGNFNSKMNVSMTTGETTIVPDYVGYKFCNSMGWRYVYYYGVAKSDGGSITWREDTQIPSYWLTYDASCRAIAKKPSMTSWNSSISTTGGIKAVTSPRYSDASNFNNTSGMLGRVTSSGNKTLTLYGSWSEYQAIANRTLVGYTSGSSLARNSAVGATDVYMYYSPLTIANSNSALGQAGITANSTLLTRLDTYLRTATSPLWQRVEKQTTSADNQTFYWSAVAAESGIDTYNVGGTHVYVISKSGAYGGGHLVIDRDIKLATQTNSIYTLPRVVIFVDGNVTVSSDVAQIDAWLIVSGSINTCGSFNKSTDIYFNNGGSRGTGTDTIHAQSGECAKELSFNGPVITNGIALNRSYGSDNLIHRTNSYTSSSTYTNNNGGYTAEATNGTTESTSWSYKFSPAEIFNYRADDYLWAYAQAGRYSSSYTESYSRELAPRY